MKYRNINVIKIYNGNSEGKEVQKINKLMKQNIKYINKTIPKITIRPSRIIEISIIIHNNCNHRKFKKIH
jgi:hypothetical protein